MQRPFLNKSINELEDVFSRSANDPDTLAKLSNELGFRKTPRAKSLKTKVADAAKLSTAQAPANSSERPANPKTERDHGHEEHVESSASACVEIRPKPEVTNEPKNILHTWAALEVLSPQGFNKETELVPKDRSAIARFTDAPLPWIKGEKSRPNKSLYYEVVIGSVVLAPAVESLLKVYADKRPDRPSVKKFTPIATVMLDKEGKPLEEDEGGITVSSFAWGVPVALQGDLRGLANWSAQEQSLIASIRKRILKYDDAGDAIPLAKDDITGLYEFLCKKLQLEAIETVPPSFAVRKYEWFRSKTPPESLLLNSFYLEDLAKAKSLAARNQLPNALSYYLGVKTPSIKTDLLNETEGLQKLLQPALTPVGRWPGNGRFPLALLQQAAVNATDPNLMETGILAVNGPPGTGKTTLLRDVVAARIVERAAVMSTYDDPETAFIPTKQKLKRDGAQVVLHKLDQRLKGFEMVVTSSNNKAVENVSAELPAIDAVAADAQELRYFKTASDNLLQRDTWGAVAAVLGNASNRYTVSQNFWRDEENGVSTYLNHASGIPQIVSEPQEDGSVLKRNRQIVDRENPPSNKREAVTRWKKAKSHFVEVKRESEKQREGLQELHLKVERSQAITQQMAKIQTDLPALESLCAKLTEQNSPLVEKLSEAKKKVQRAAELRDRHSGSKPSWLARLLRRSEFKTWKIKFDRLRSDVNHFDSKRLAIASEADALERQLKDAQRQRSQLSKQLDRLKGERDQLVSDIDEIKAGLDVEIPDSDFFEGDDEKVQTSSVWFDKASQHLRDDVFEAAIKVHRAFIDCAADPLRQNLSVFVNSFGTRSLGTPQKDELIPDLWASFFLLVPVVSTTFASVHRMFSRLAPETLGWLLVDEAGQAVPQAVVGAMMRTQRSVVVGDPLQIQPVVTLPNSLTEEICGYFGVDALQFNAPEASVQTLADAASIFCARFPSNSGFRDVGAPLLVHRRCDSPMFDISNEIAYANLMVQAKFPSPNNPHLGRSSWVNVIGKAGPDKWCADEAVALIEMLQKLKSSGGEADLYVVTPFVIVQNNLRTELLKSGVLDGWVSNPRSWVNQHVGTVHTVQGREAKIVFFVLGAQMASQNGARAWAGGSPNLVNVAVTRAKESLYVIGNKQLWKSAGHFATLDRLLPEG